MDYPNYYGIIPAVVRYAKIADRAKILFSEITALANQWGYCNASNGYFAKLYDCTPGAISQHIASLSKAGFIRCEYLNEPGPNNTLLQGERRIYPLAMAATPFSTAKDPLKHSLTPPLAQLKHNNTSINNKDIVDFEQIDGEASNELLISSYHIVQTKDENREEKNTLPGDVLAYLNEKAGTAYRPSAKAHVTLINARAKEGYTLADFKSVIDTKCAEWLKDAKMRKFLRPSTLFNATHFPEYLNQKQIDASATNQHEGQNEVTPHDEKYNAYLSWCKRNTPAIIDNVKHLSKAQYIQFVERTFHAQAKEFSGEFNSRRLTKAHNEMNAYAADMEKYKDVWTKFLADYDSFMKKATMQ